MSASRDQLSLFIGDTPGRQLDALRAVLDPIQAALIPAHVTVCREDELGSLDLTALAARLHGATALTLQFGAPARFGGHGVLLPCLAGQDGLDALRRQLLGRDDLRPQPAHITLAHPRNPPAPGNRDPLPQDLPAMTLTLTDLRWIRQTAGGPWQTMARFSLGPAPR